MFNAQIAIEAFCKAKVDVLINVPATGMTPVYDFFEERNACIYAVREEEAVALACGISIAGKLPLLLIQQSGVGNMLNALIGLAEGYDIYFPIIVLDRGVDDENPIQAFSSLKTIPIIKVLGKYTTIDFSKPSAAENLRQSIADRFRMIISTY